MLITSAGVAQQAPPPGTSIENQAEGQYMGSTNDDTISVTSNTVRAIIQSAANIRLVESQQTKARPEQIITFAHRITNTGNTTATIIVTASNGTDDDYNFDNIGLSSKKDGKSNKNSAAPSDSLTTTLEPGGEYLFEVSGRVSETATTGQQGKIMVRAETGKETVSRTNRDVVEILEGPTIEAKKGQPGENIMQGQEWHYELSAANSGDQTAEPVPVIIDGKSQNKLLLTDPIPVNTTFKAIEDEGSGLALYHTIGSAEGEYRTTLPPDRSTIDQIALAADSLAPGQTLKAAFAVTINSNATGTIQNRGELWYYDPVDDSGQITRVPTNIVQAALPEYNPVLHYFTDDSYSTVSYANRLSKPLRLQADAAACNLHFTTPDTISVTLTSEETEDSEQATAVETAGNSGIFRVTPDMPTRSAKDFEVTANNGIMETVANDVITATAPGCSDQAEGLRAQTVVSPFGVVFDSQTNETVAGAVVELIDVTGEGNGGNAGGPAQVMDEDGEEPVANPQTTAEDGEFYFPYMQPSTYRVEITTPGGDTFPSTVPPEEWPENRNMHRQASYGKSFSVTDEPVPATFDLPVDPETAGDLFIEKTSSASRAEIGDFVTYQLTVANNSPDTVTQVRVEDTLPFGFRYEEGTAQVDGTPIGDPEGGNGPALDFSIGDIAGNSSVTLTYRVLLGAGTRIGEATNTAQATSGGTVPKVSNEAQHTIGVRGGVFSDKGYIIGKVFADFNNNDVQDPGEPGIPGVRLYLENGSFVITDSEGKYTFYGIRPNKHVVKIDNFSLPKGSKLAELDNRHAGDPSSRFVDLKKGQMHRADFAICEVTPAVKQEIDARNREYQSVAGEALDASVERDFSVDGNSSRRTIKREKASGVIDGADIPGRDKTQPTDVSRRPADSTFVDTAKTAASRALSLEEAMVYEEAELGFIGLQDSDTLQTAQTTIWVKSKGGASLVLKVNGQKIGDDRISKKSALSELNLQAQEYIGVKLQPGKNTITLSETDPFGNQRGKKEITVFAPGQVDQITLDVPVDGVPADGTSAAVVRVRLQDEKGVAVQSKIPVTLDVSAGQWLVKDEDPSTPGTQTYVKGGSAEFELQSIIRPQDVKARVSVGVLEAETAVSFLPDLRPLIAAGIIEGTIRLNEKATLVPARSADGFERELKSLSYSTGNATADARAAFFLKGKIKGNMLLTAGFDSEKNDERLFRDIQPDEFYPVYGESSIKGYDAQSTGRLYVRVDHKKTYALYGDFVTQRRHPAKSLGEYNRTQTGLKLHYEKEWARLNVFGSQATSLQRIDEFRGQGLSGPYELDSENILINSEQVEIITRDRNQPSVVINREQLSRFRDYVIEPFTGNIIFKSPVPSADEELNPIFIRVTYEVEDGAEDYLMGGADGQFKVTDFWEVGGSFVEDRNPEDKYRLKSINTTLKLGKQTVLIGEVAESTTDLEGSGQGGRVELQHRGDKVDGRLYAGQTEQDFVNRSARLGQGRTEVGGRGSAKLTNSTKLAGEFIYSSNDTLRKNTTGGVLNIQQRFTDDIRAEVGMRYSQQNQSQSGMGSSGQEDITHKNLRGKLTVGVPKVEGASLFGEYEQDISESDRRLIAVGGDYRLKNRGKIYARHEFISSARGAYTLNSSTRRQNTIVGIDANYMQNGEVYSEYRVDDAFDGQNAQAAIGLRHRFEIHEGFGINAGFERIISITGDSLNEGTAISTSVDYTANPLWKGTARAEARFSRNGNRYLNTLGYGRKINPNWTFLGKNIFNLSTSSREGAANQIQQRMRVGLAYRQTAKNRWDGLGRYELKYEENGQFGGDFNRLVHIFSTNVNYHPAGNWAHSGRLSVKKVAESSAEFDARSLTMLLSARTMYDITRKLDGGLNASLMTDGDFGGKDYGAGLEVGYIVQRNLRLAVGFNIFGFEDRDLAASNYTRKGVYVGFSYKFDERLFRGLMPEEDRYSEVYATCGECITPPQQTHVLSMPEADVDLLGLQPVIPEARPIPKPRCILLPLSVHFAFDKETITEPSRKMLDHVVDFLKDQQVFTLAIAGHTDSQGSQHYNLNLSKRRAQVVQAYLDTQGVNKNRIALESLSEKDLKIRNEQDGIDRAQNRRVKLSLNLSAHFVDQINDLQVNKNLRDIGDWDYIFNPQNNAVPEEMHVKESRLNAVNKYLLDRLAMTLKNYPEETVVINAPDEQKKGIKSYLQQSGAAMDRINLTTNTKSSDDTVTLEYGPESKLETVSQNDDIRYAHNEKVKSMLHKMVKLLKLRQDQRLIDNDRR